MFFQAKKCISTWPMSHQSRRHSWLGWSQYVFFTVGFVALSYVSFTLVESSLFQAYQSWRFEEAVKSMQTPTGGADPFRPQTLPVDPEVVNNRRVANPDIAGRTSPALGRIEIRSIGLSAMILEGTDDRTLRRAVGHIPGTPLPGRRGNVAIAGHRDTFFRPLRNIRKDDEIKLATLTRSYLYRVDSTRVVGPEDIEVLEASDQAILTLVTCYPFNFVGSSPKRFIVRAHRTTE
jgi:sortase A